MDVTTRVRNCRPSTGPVKPGNSMKNNYAKLTAKPKTSRAMATSAGKKKPGAKEIPRRAIAGKKSGY